MKAVVWDDAALQELDAALGASPDSAAFKQEVADALATIASGTLSYPCVGRSQARECRVPGRPYSLIYTEIDDSVRVWVLAHNKRKPGYWRNRLPKT
jgi:hypothetical protein